MANSGNVNTGKKIVQNNPSAPVRTPQQVPDYTKRQDINTGIKQGRK
jgi:hypothetical protein